MTVREIKSLDVASFTVALTGVSSLISLIIGVILVGAVSVIVPNSFGAVIYLLPGIVFSTMICGIFIYFSEAYLYNILSKKLGTIKLDIDENTILKIKVLLLLLF